MIIKHTMSEQYRKHDTICAVVGAEAYNLYGGVIDYHIVYNRGELDVLHHLSNSRIYYEIKSNFHLHSYQKGKAQILRAIDNGMCDSGYIVYPYDIIEIVPNKNIKKENLLESIVNNYLIKKIIN